jgi:hypothetical protein
MGGKVNAVAYLVEAAPDIRMTAERPTIVPRMF